MSAFDNRSSINAIVGLLHVLEGQFYGNKNQSEAIIQRVKAINDYGFPETGYYQVYVVFSQIHGFLVQFIDRSYFLLTWMSNNDNEGFQQFHKKLDDLIFKLSQKIELDIPSRQLAAQADRVHLCKIVGEFSSDEGTFSSETKGYIDYLTEHSSSVKFELLPSLRQIDANLVEVDPTAELGGGKFSIVQRQFVRGVATGVKSLKTKLLPEDVDPEQMKIDMKREAHILQLYDIPGVIRFYGVDNKDEPTTIYLEWAEGTLRDVYTKKILGIQALPLTKKLQMLKSCCDTYALLHSYGVIHRDIKSSNVLVMADGTTRVADFGTTRSKLFEHSLGVVPKGTHAYMAPELLMDNDKYIYSEQTDIYAFAIMMNEFLTEQMPFPIQFQQLIGKMYATGGKVRPDLYSGDHCAIINQEIAIRWDTNPAARGTFSELSAFLDNAIKTCV